jgi:cytochrome c5
MGTQNTRFFDTFTLVIGSLIAIAIALAIFALFFGGQTQQDVRENDVSYRLALAERIAPFGKVRLAGEDTDEEASDTAIQVAEPVPTAMSGPQVYNAACVACHGPGIGGAPKNGDVAAWASRLAQARETLNRHAIEGFQGEAGYMPPKGGRMDLSDEEILAAVDFMIGESS